MAENSKSGSGLVIGGAAAVIAGITFFGFDGIGKIKKAFADKSPSTQATESSVDDIQTEKIDVEDVLTPDDESTNNNVIVQSNNIPQKEDKTSSKSDIVLFTAPTKLTSNRIELQKSTVAPQVLKPKFTTKAEKETPVEFNKRKFGIDEKALQVAVSKPISKQTRKEKLLIEAEKARLIFDSRSISNF